jgi:hypothetical protein
MMAGDVRAFHHFLILKAVRRVGRVRVMSLSTFQKPYIRDAWSLCFVSSSRWPHVVVIMYNGSSREASGKLAVDTIGTSLDFLFLHL